MWDRESDAPTLGVCRSLPKPFDDSVIFDVFLVGYVNNIEKKKNKRI